MDNYSEYWQAQQKKRNEQPKPPKPKNSDVIARVTTM